METIDYLLEYEQYLHVSNLLITIFRFIGWWIILLFKVLLEGMEKVTDNVFKLVDFLTNTEVKTFINDNLLLAYGIGTVCLVLFFFRYMGNKNASMKGLFTNLLLFVGVIVLCVTVTSTLTSKVFGVAKAINHEGTTAAATIINENIYDVTSFDVDDWSGAQNARHVSYTSSQYTFFNIMETINPKKMEFSSDKSKEILSNQVILDEKGEYELVKLDTGMFTVSKEYYYRYSWRFWTMLFTLLMTIAVTFFSTFKYLQSLYNIGYNGVIMPFFAGTDFNEGSKIQKIISSTLNIFVNVLLYAVSLKVYRLFVVYISDAPIDGFSQLVFQLMLTTFLFEGPWVIQELTGIDGGVKSSVGQAMALGASAFYGAKGMKSLGNKAKDVSKNIGDKAKHASKFMAGLTDGAIDKESLKEKLQPKDKQAKNDQVKPEVPNLSNEEKQALNKELNEGQSGPDTSPEQAKPGVSPEGQEAAQPETTDPRETQSSEHSKDHALNGTNSDRTTGEKEKTGTAKSQNEESTPSLKVPDRPKAEENASEAYSDVLKKGSHGQLSEKGSNDLSQKTPGELLKEQSTGEKPNTMMQAQNQLQGVQNQLQNVQKASNDLSKKAANTLPSGPSKTAKGNQVKPSFSGHRSSLKADGSQLNATKQALGKVPVSSSVLQIPSTSRQVIASHALGNKPVTRPIVQAPASIAQISAVQALKQDIAKYNQPVTDQTVTEFVSEKLVDRQIQKAQKRAEKQAPYVVTRQVGKNTGEALRKGIESSSLRRVFRSSKQKKD